jgi:hypothetical protein
MAEQPVVAKVDAGGTKDIDPDQSEHDTGFAEKPGSKANNPSRW